MGTSCLHNRKNKSFSQWESFHKNQFLMIGNYHNRKKQLFPTNPSSADNEMLLLSFVSMPLYFCMMQILEAGNSVLDQNSHLGHPTRTFHPILHLTLDWQVSPGNCWLGSADSKTQQGHTAPLIHSDVWGDIHDLWRDCKETEKRKWNGSSCLWRKY